MNVSTPCYTHTHTTLYHMHIKINIFPSEHLYLYIINPTSIKSFSDKFDFHCVNRHRWAPYLQSHTIGHQDNHR